MKGKGKEPPGFISGSFPFGAGGGKGDGKGWHFGGKKGKGPIGFFQQQAPGPCANAFFTAGLLAATAVREGAGFSFPAPNSPLYSYPVEWQLPPLPFDLATDPLKVSPPSWSTEPAYVPIWSAPDSTPEIPLFPLTRGDVWSFQSAVEGLIIDTGAGANVSGDRALLRHEPRVLQPLGEGWEIRKEQARGNFSGISGPPLESDEQWHTYGFLGAGTGATVY